MSYWRACLGSYLEMSNELSRACLGNEYCRTCFGSLWEINNEKWMMSNCRACLGILWKISNKLLSSMFKNSFEKHNVELAWDELLLDSLSKNSWAWLTVTQISQILPKHAL